MLSLGGQRHIMKKLNFLDKLKDEEILMIVEPSDEISKSYLVKSAGKS